MDNGNNISIDKTIQDLDVISEMRSQGIGSLLMKASKEYGIARGADFIRTQVFPTKCRGLEIL